MKTSAKHFDQAVGP